MPSRTSWSSYDLRRPVAAMAVRDVVVVVMR
jgi:hypothetical protein